MLVTSSTTSHFRSAVCSSRLNYSRVTIYHIETYSHERIRQVWHAINFSSMLQYGVSGVWLQYASPVSPVELLIGTYLEFNADPYL